MASAARSRMACAPFLGVRNPKAPNTSLVVSWQVAGGKWQVAGGKWQVKYQVRYQVS